MTGQERLLQMGTIGRPHGIRGEFGVFWEGDFLPEADTPIFLKFPGLALREYLLSSCRWHNGKALFKLEDINDRTAAEKLNGAAILLPEAVLPPLAEGEAYLADLLGCQVRLPDGEVLGVLDHFEFPANLEIWAIKSPEGSEILFPARQEFIENIDLAAHIVTITPPPGLVDIYRA